MNGDDRGIQGSHSAPVGKQDAQSSQVLGNLSTRSFCLFVELKLIDLIFHEREKRSIFLSMKSSFFSLDLVNSVCLAEKRQLVLHKVEADGVPRVAESNKEKAEGGEKNVIVVDSTPNEETNIHKLRGMSMIYYCRL